MSTERDIKLSIIQEAVNNSNWDLATTLITIYRETHCVTELTDIFYILEASCLMHERDYAGAQESIRNGLVKNIYNYELYFMLGNLKEALGNDSQALFCYENAVFYAQDDDIKILEDYLDNFNRSHTHLPGKAAIIIVSYENLDFTRQCVKSIENTVYPGAYDIIIIDNHSTDGTREWLAETSYKYIINRDNKGFPAACNQGIALAAPDSDIFLLNNDTLLMPGSLFCLRMALYEASDIGMTGAVSNMVSNRQQIKECFSDLEDYLNYSIKNNIYTPAAWEQRLRLIGFAMLLKRPLLEEIGYLDEGYGLGYYEDNDICIRFLEAGYRLMLCRDSFIYHYGNQSFGKNLKADSETHYQKIDRNLNYFMNKWGLDLSYYADPELNFIRWMSQDNIVSPRILEIGCGLGATMLELKKLYPDAFISGVEILKEVRRYIPRCLQVKNANIADFNLDYPKHFFDFILLRNIFTFQAAPTSLLEYLKEFLTDKGVVLSEISNLPGEDILEIFTESAYQITNLALADTNTHKHIIFETDCPATLVPDIRKIVFDIGNQSWTFIIKAIPL